MKDNSIDILLMVTKSAVFVWHLYQHVNLNTTRELCVFGTSIVENYDSLNPASQNQFSIPPNVENMTHLTQHPKTSLAYLELPALLPFTANQCHF